MFDSLKNIFSSGNPPRDSLEEESEFDIGLPENPNFVIDKSRIFKLLKDLSADVSLCGIQIEGFKETFTSTILEVSEEKGFFVLDELTPAQGNKLLIAKNGFKLSTKLRGVYLSFETVGVEDDIANGIAYYRVKVPEKIYYPQRRESPRLLLNSLQIPFQAVSSRNQVTITGQVLDISRGGVGIKLFDNRARIQRGEKLTQCRIALNSDFIINFDLTVRSIKPLVGNSSFLHMGGYFEKLQANSRKKLEHFLAALEREEIRRSKQ